MIVDWQCIEAMAQSYRQRAMEANASGYANYTIIRNSYSMVRCLDTLFFFLLKRGRRDVFLDRSVNAIVSVSRCSKGSYRVLNS